VQKIANNEHLYSPRLEKKGGKIQTANEQTLTWPH